MRCNCLSVLLGCIWESLACRMCPAGFQGEEHGSHASGYRGSAEEQPQCFHLQPDGNRSRGHLPLGRHPGVFQSARRLSRGWETTHGEEEHDGWDYITYTKHRCRSKPVSCDADGLKQICNADVRLKHSHKRFSLLHEHEWTSHDATVLNYLSPQQCCKCSFWNIKICIHEETAEWKWCILDANTISPVILLTKVILFACFTYHNIAKALVQKQWQKKLCE